MVKGFSEKLAEYEIGWWKAHHRKDINLLIKNMTNLYVLQFSLPYKLSFNAVKYRVKATKEHDIAEKFEDQGNQLEADKHWKKAQQLLKQHFEILNSYKK